MSAHRPRRSGAAASPAWWSVLIWAALAAGVSGGAPDSSVVHPLRVAFSSSMFADVNANDAKASVKAWGQELAEDMDMRVDIQTRIETDPVVLREDLLAGRLECVSLTVVEFLAIERLIPVGPIVLGEQSGEPTQEYVVLVPAEGPVQDLGDLRGRNITFYENPRTCLAMRWLELTLNEAGHGGRPESFFGSVSGTTKLSGAVLPVFFGQVDGCVVTRSGFEVMVELNPQVGRTLREIASSAPVVPMLVFIRDDVDPELKQNIIRALLDANQSASGRQLLTLFQTTGLTMAPAGCLDTARALYAGVLPPLSAGNMLKDEGGLE